MGAMTYIT